jgi:beta-lactamase class A
LADPAEPLLPIDERIGALERRYNAAIGLFATGLDRGRSISHRGQDAFAMCSTFKGYATARALQMVASGQLFLDQPVFVDPAGLVANSPRNLLLKAIGGPQAVTAFARTIGDQRTRLDRWETELNTAVPGDPRDTSTPEALGGDYGSANDIGVASGPAGQRLLLAIMTRSRADDPKARSLRPAIGELTSLLMPELPG